MLPARALADDRNEDGGASAEVKIDAKLLRQAESAKTGERLEALFVLDRGAQLGGSKFRTNAVVNGLRRR